MNRKSKFFAGLAVVSLAMVGYIQSVPDGIGVEAIIADGEKTQIDSVKVGDEPSPRANEEIAPKPNDIPVLPAVTEKKPSAAAQALAYFNEIFERYRQGDESLTDGEILHAELEAGRLIEESAEARAMFSAKLDAAMRSGDVLSIYALERAFKTSVEGLPPLIDIYESEIRRDGELGFYAIQGLNQLQPYLTEVERLRHFEMAARLFSRNDSFDLQLPSMLFMAEAASNPNYQLPPTHRETALRMIQSRQLNAKTESEQLFSAQSLYRLLPQPQATDFARRVLASQPSPGYVQAALEAVRAGRIPLDGPLRSSLETSIRSVSLSPEQLALAQQVLGTPQPPPRTGAG